MFNETNEEKNFDIKGFLQGELIFSNSVEVLLEFLKLRLFANTDTPFSERLLIVPSQAMQQWIQLQLANSMGIAAGFTPLFFEQAIELLYKRFYSPNLSFGLASSDSEEFIQVNGQGVKPKTQVLSPPSFSSELTLFFRIEHELKQALLESDPLWEPIRLYCEGKEKRLFYLAKDLTKLFVRYGIFGGKALEKWKRYPTGWQETLWSRVFADHTYAYEKLSHLSLNKKVPPKPLSIHLFAFSSLSPLHLHYFQSLGKHLSVTLYQLSPCQEFWSTLDEQTPPLLAHLGKLGRVMNGELERQQFLVEEAYLAFGGESQLKILQRDLLHHRKTEGALGDDSLQLHCATLPSREIEVVHHLLYNLVSSSSLRPQDILVMAPNIADYAPYIQHFFGKTLGFQIADLPVTNVQPAVQALFMMLNLERNRWKVASVLELLDHPLVRRKLKFSEEELLKVHSWVRKARIRWAFDASHRERLLPGPSVKPHSSDPSGTWKEGLSILLADLVLFSETPLLQYSEAQLLGNLIFFLTKLKEKLDLCQQRHTLKDWALILKSLVHDFIGESEEALSLTSHLERFGAALLSDPTRLYPLTYLLPLLEEELQHDQVNLNRNLLTAVRFCSLLPMRAIPAKVICLIGLNDEHFPRRDTWRSFDLLRDNPESDYCPTRLDFDRYLILEALLSAREKLILSYCGYDPYDLTERPPSSVVQDFLPYIAQNQIFHHPPYALEKTPAPSVHPLITVTSPKTFTPPEGTFTIPLSELNLLIRAPLRFYLNTHGIKLKEEPSLESEEPLFLSPLQKAIFEKENRELPNGEAPLGMLKEVAQMQIERLRSLRISLPTEKKVIDGLTIALSEKCHVRLVGVIEGGFEESYFTQEKSSWRGILRSLPSFLTLASVDHRVRALQFADGETKSAYFEDPLPHLKTLINYYFLAQSEPSPLVLDWVEPILRSDLKKLKQAPLYETTLSWYLKGREAMELKQVIEAWHPWAAALYQEVADAWL